MNQMNESDWRNFVELARKQIELETEEPCHPAVAERFAEGIAYAHHAMVGAEGSCPGCSYCCRSGYTG
jgi:hypothetical protein